MSFCGSVNESFVGIPSDDLSCGCVGAQNLEILDDNFSKALVVKAVCSDTINSNRLGDNFFNSVLVRYRGCMVYKDSGILKIYKYI